jgi:hypothetical protein
MNKNELLAKLTAIKAENPNGLNWEGAFDKALSIVADEVEQKELAERELAQARAELAAAKNRSKSFTPFRSNVQPIDIALIERGALEFRKNIDLAGDADLAPIDEALSVGATVLAAVVPMLAGGNMSGLGVTIAPLAKLVFDFVNS